MKMIKKLNIPAHLAIAELADRSFWEGTKGCGDRISYKNLISLRNIAEDGKQKKEIQDHINRIIDDYKTSILIPRVDNIKAVCQQGAMVDGRCMAYEPVKEFSAANVVEHLDITKYPRCTSRARALNILRNFDTAKGENKEDMKKDIIERLVFILENDPSLLVSKLALDRYEQFTDYSPPSKNIFNFEEPIKHHKEKYALTP